MKAKLYLRAGEYEKAIEAYNWIVNKMGTLDPAIDKAIEKCNTAISKRKIEQMIAEGRPQEEIDAEKKANYDYRMERFHERIRLYPNDLQIRFEYAELLWEGGAVDDALVLIFCKVTNKRAQKRKKKPFSFILSSVSSLCVANVLAKAETIIMFGSTNPKLRNRDKLIKGVKDVSI